MFQMLDIKNQGAICTVTLNRPEQRNSLNATTLEELHIVLDQAEQNPQNRIIIIQGKDGVFCTGMDFEAAVNRSDNMDSNVYMTLLHRFSTISRTVITRVEGVVMAGGIGLVAASDLVIGTSSSQFSLSEALWGLLPCCVAPYLIRRIGFQAAYRLTLTTQSISAEEAHRLQLIDLFTSTPEEEIRKQCLRLSRIDPQTLKDLKSYFRKLWLVDEVMEATAVEEINRLMQTPRVQKNLLNYVQNKLFPWEVQQETVK